MTHAPHLNLQTLAGPTVALAQRIDRTLNAFPQHPEWERYRQVLRHLLALVDLFLQAGADDGTELMAAPSIEIEGTPSEQRRDCADTRVLQKLVDQCGDDPGAATRYVWAAAAFCYRCGLDYLHLVKFDES